MDGLARVRAWSLTFTDRFLPTPSRDPGDVHRLRMSLFHVWTGVGFTAAFGLLYAVAGSPISSASVLLVTLALLLTPLAIRRGASVAWAGNVLVAATWIATAVTATRSGGFSSPILVDVFLFPLVTYAACGPRSAVVWAVLSCLQIGSFGVAELVGVELAHDFSARAISVLRLTSYGGVIATIVLALAFVASARRATFAEVDANNRAVERARVLDDVHDGVGAQLVGLLVQVRAGTLEQARLVGALESCVDDLRVVVSSEAAREGDLASALAEVRARFEPRLEAAGIVIAWSIELEQGSDLGGATTLQAVRVLQEMLTNVLRHASASRVEVHASVPTDATMLELSVRDDGRGFDPARPPTAGRGLRSMTSRARQLGGTLALEPASPGMRVTLRVPIRPGRAVTRS